MLNTVCKCVSHSQLAAIMMMMYMGFQGKQLKSVCAWFPLFFSSSPTLFLCRTYNNVL